MEGSGHGLVCTGMWSDEGTLNIRQVLVMPAIWASRVGLMTVAGWLESWRSSLAARQFISCRYDGVDWEYRWGSSRIFYPSPGTNPVALCSVNLSLFQHHYQPRSGDVVLDVGAGIGTEVAAFSGAIGDSGRLIAVEADPEAFRRLKRLISASGFTNVTAVHAAVTDRAGSVMLACDGGEGVTNSIRTSGGTFVRVPALTLDSLVEELDLGQVDFLKMNIEGAETLALSGFTEHWEKVKNWCISCHDFLPGESFKTLDFVIGWMRQRNLSVLRLDAEPGKPWVEFYVFAERAKRE